VAFKGVNFTVWNQATRWPGAGGVQGGELASPALPCFRKNPGRESLPGPEQKILNKRIVTSVQKKPSPNTPLASLNINL